MLSFLSVVVNVAILWSQTTVVIPLGSSLESYKSVPSAEIKINNQVVNDPNMYYEYEVRHTTFTVIRTNVVGTYTVFYKVHFPTYGFSSEQAISFVVVDHVSPVITGDKDIYLDVGTKLPSLNTMVTYTDNYDPVAKLVLTIDTNSVNMNIVGVYEVTYRVKDLSGNEALFKQNVFVVDRLSPTIAQKSQINLKINERIDLDKYFTFTDNHDKVLSILLDDKLVNYQVPGTYEITVKATDQSGNQTTIKTNVSISDTEKPTIKLKTSSVTINYQETLSIDRLRDYIQSITDNLDDLSIDDVIITSFVESDFLGNYQVEYRITDAGGQTAIVLLTVVVKDLTAPAIELLDEIIVDVHTLEPYILDYLLITDNYNKREELTVTLSGKVDMNKIGEYRVIVNVKDAAKNEMILPVIVYVVDKVVPQVTLPEEILVTNFIRPNYQTLIVATDNYDKSLNIIVDDSFVDYQTVGSYIINVKVRDTSYNETTGQFILTIVDYTYPEVILTTNKIYVPYGEKINDFSTYIHAVYDAYDKHLTIDDVEIISNINFNVVGLYQAIYRITDDSFNESESILYVYVSDYQQPVIYAQNITIQKGQSFNYLNYASAYDDYDGDLSLSLRINPNFIPTSIPGFYEVTYYVHDSSGNYAEMKILLTITSNDDWMDYVLYALGFIGILGTGLAFYYFKNRRAKL